MKICKHFGICGGCSFQDIPYSQQVTTKKNRVEALIKKYGIKTLTKEVNTFDTWFYRNKMEFTFFEKDSGIICGFHEKENKRQVTALSECPISFSDTDVILSAVCAFAQKNGYSAYNKYSHKGFLRNLIIRQSKFTKQTMIVLVTTDEIEFNVEKYKEMIISIPCEYPVNSVYRVVNNSWSDAVVFEKKEHIWGEEYIVEKINDLKFKIGPDTFFQVNPKGMSSLYSKIMLYADLTRKKRILDLYCGAGGIGMGLAKKADFVWGVELSPDIVKFAQENAEQNNIKNITFIAQDVRLFLNTQDNTDKKIDLVVVNPPRGGLSQKVIRAIKRLLPSKLIYSSCNPEALCRDLKEFSDQYTIEFVEPFDFFPHTKHLECLAVLTKNNDEKDIKNGII
ncbi:MAG: 23S rRNA (uracil(1939)-C(5))-methyltransferase RlmD [Candidatus Omnitrophica bacterium]|jgi:23S rRNA (uracil-5-)-methyltransferase RumA|nr:23S rRNA (uracil(1939)-C(5))-methyltransferase RlmD [Candidatus Omnitrophota bacterium]MDD5081370.1 23S rRNA (uracil(1939)-C(5))-methyltransferase RlmD [Candidatus Omnitrophota bacterium]